MNCTQISTQLGFRCKPIRDGLMYVQSPIALAFDGLLIGAYVQDIGRGLVRISDNADTLFTAMTHGIAPNAKRAKTFSAIAQQSGISLSDNGELHATCPEDQAGFYMARFIEAAARIGNACDDQLVVPVSKFERKVGDILAKRFKNRLRRNFSLVGASGHQLAFPFVLYPGTAEQMIIQTISSGRGGKPNWASIYGATGKLGDLKNSGDLTRRTVILQNGDPDAIEQATIALAENASIIVYTGNDDELAYALAS